MTGDDMHVNVWDRLAGVSADVHSNIEPCRFQRASNAHSCSADQFDDLGDFIGCEVKHVGDVSPGNNECMTR